MEKVVALFIKGNNPTVISRELNISRGKVLEHIDSYKSLAQNDTDIRGRARELLVTVDEHYNMLVKDLWWVVEEGKTSNNLKEVTAALKAIAQIEKDRAQLYSTAGITADDELGEQLAQMEEEHEKIKDILRTVSADCPRCRAKVFKALAEINGQPEVIVVQEGVID